MARPRLYSDEERKQRHREASAAYYERHKAKCHAATNKWRSENIERNRELDRIRFKSNPVKMYLKGVKYRTENREKRREIERSWRKRNPFKTRAIDHRRRAKLVSAKGYDYTKAHHIEARWEMFSSKCWVCGKAANHTDHVKPLDAGGSHYPANLRPICISCNSRKKNRWPIPAYVFLSAGSHIPGLSFIDRIAIVPEFTSPTPSPAVPPV